MKASELRQKNADELKNELIGVVKKQFSMRVQKATGQPFKSHEVKRARRNIARIKTVLTEKQGDNA
jgi:large subunit ribosomal protein L29